MPRQRPATVPSHGSSLTDPALAVSRGLHVLPPSTEMLPQDALFHRTPNITASWRDRPGREHYKSAVLSLCGSGIHSSYENLTPDDWRWSRGSAAGERLHVRRRLRSLTLLTSRCVVWFLVLNRPQTSTSLRPEGWGSLLQLIIPVVSAH